jgi:CheY-like chemotaxis protein
VEDNQPDVMLVRQALSQRGLQFSVHEMSDAEEAAAYIERMGDTEKSPCPDIVLLDLNVPKGDGLELLKAFRASPKCPGVPIIVMTSSDSPRDRAKANEMGTTLYFRKPIELDEYLRLGILVEEVLKERIGSMGGTGHDGSRGL